jgi:hypothetical protein
MIMIEMSEVQEEQLGGKLLCLLKGANSIRIIR